MTADEIKALVEQLRSSGYASHFALNQLARKAGEVLETLSDQLLAKTELANLYAASLRKVEREVEALTQENQRLRLEFRADCEKHAQELFAVQMDAERYRYLRETTKAVRDDSGNNRTEVTPDSFDERVDAAIAARSQSEEKP